MSAILRIAVLNQREGGGATAQARDLLALAAARGHTTACFPDGSDREPAALLDRLAAFRPDVVHAHCFYNTWPPETLRAVGARFPTAFTVHDVYPSNQYGTECWECLRNPWCYACPALPLPKRLYSIYRVRSRRSREAAWRGLEAHVIYPTAWMRRRMSRTALARLDSSVIPYGIDTQLFARDPLARDKLGLPLGVPLVLCVGSMYSDHDDRKGFAYLLPAFARVRAQLPDARLVIIGRTFGLAAAPGVTILDDVARSDLPLWYSAASVFALPSLGDNAPLAILEAMSCACPVVATRVGGIPEEVEEGVTGMLVPPRDAPALAEAALRLLRDPALRSAFGSAARARVDARFRRDPAFDAHEATFHRLVGSRRRRGE